MGFDNLDNQVSDNRRQAAMDNRAIAQSAPGSDRGMSFDDFDDDDFGFGDDDSSFDSSDNTFGNNDSAFGGGSFGGGSFGGMNNNSFGGDNSFGNDSFGGGGNSFGGNNAFGGNSTFGGNSFNSGADFGMNTGMNSSFGSNNMFGQQQPMQQNQGGIKPENLEQAAMQFGKQSLDFFKDFMRSVKTFDANRRGTMGRYAAVTGIIVIIISVMLMIFGRFSIGVEMLIGSLLTTGTGVMLLCFGQSSVAAGQNTPPTEPQMTPAPAPVAAPAPTFDDPEVDLALDDSSNTSGGFDPDFSWDNDDDNSSFNDENDESSSDETEDEDEDVSFDDWDAAEVDIDAGLSSTEPEPINVADAINALSSVTPNGLIERRALMEKAMSILQSVNPSFGEKHVIEQTEEKFKTLDTIVQDSADALKPANSTELPYLVEAIDTPFYIRLEITRPKYLKNIEQYTQEIVSVFQYDKSTGKRDMSIYGIGDAVGNKIYIKLMKGSSVTVSLRDLYGVCKDEVLDMNNKMPVVLGIDIEGVPVVRDFSSLYSILITGMPRSGKSWLLKNLLWQMMLYNSPRDLQFYFCDPKAGISDFTTEITPHVRKFVTADDSIVALLKYLVHVEGPRRKEEMGKEGFIDIKDYRKVHPNCNMPIIYVVIDEVVTLSDRMDVDTKKEFQGLLSELVSQLPAAGIRIFLVPHLVKDNIIKKNVTSMIPCRISVWGDAQHIEDSCGVKNFKHVLRYPGDTCTKLAGDKEALFIHNNILANSNEDVKQLFNYLAELWARLEPDMIAGSVYERKQKGLPLFEDAAAPTHSTTTGGSGSAAGTVASTPSAFEPQAGLAGRSNVQESRQSRILNNPVEDVDLFDDNF